MVSKFLLKISLTFLVLLILFQSTGMCFSEALKTEVGRSDAASSNNSAEGRLAKLALKSEGERKTGGCLTAGLGFFPLVGGLAAITYPHQMEASQYAGIGYALIFGIGGMGLGIASFNLPSQVEIDYKQITSLPNSTEAEKSAREAIAARFLKDNSDQEFQNRIINGLFSIGFAAVCFGFPEQGSGFYVIGGIYSILGLSDLVFRSSAEKEYDEYIKENASTLEDHN